MGYTYSVIIPHYAIPDLLSECVESIPVREDIQVIVVDDHSPDGETFPERYPALRRPGVTFVRTPENLGGGHARNVGLGLAEGKWIVFSDSDDIFTEGAFRTMDRYSGSDADIVYFPFCKDEVDGFRTGSKYLWLNNLFDLYRETGDDSRIRCYHVMPWSKMISRDFVERLGLRFDEIRYSDDVMFNVLAGTGASKVAVGDEGIYRVRFREGSVSNPRAWDSNLLYLRAETGMRVNRIIKEKYSYDYDDAYVSLKNLAFFNFRAFLKLYAKAPRNRMSLLRITREVAAKALNRLIPVKR